MGFFGSIGSKVRNILRFDKENIALELAKGSLAGTAPDSSFQLLQNYGEDPLGEYLKIERDLLSRFVDYENMEEYPELASALDIFADDATCIDSMKNRSVWVDSDDETVQQILEDLFHKQLRIEEEIWSKARTLCKYGNDYDEMVVGPTGLLDIVHLLPGSMRRVEGRRGEHYGFVQDFRGKSGYSPDEFKQMLAQRPMGMTSDPMQSHAVFEPWEVAHARLRSINRRSIYGVGVLEPARHIWKRLMLMEDAALVFRLQRAPERYAFYVNTGELNPREQKQMLEKARQQFKKQKFYNQSNQKLDLKFNPLGQDEDFFIATKNGDTSTRVEVLGTPSWQSMQDIEYFRLKLFSAIKVPKTYLGYEGSPAKGTLSQEDVRFARSIMRVQNELRHSLRKMAIVHLAALGIDHKSVNFEIYMTIPSAVFEVAQMEAKNAKAAFATQMGQFVSVHWILSKIFGLSDEEVEFLIKEKRDEQLADAEVQAKVQEMMMGVQVDAQAKSQQINMDAAQATKAAKAPAEGGPKREDLRALGGLTANWPAMKKVYGYKNINESELFNGNRNHEKRVEDNFSKVLKEHSDLKYKLSELGALLQEIKMAKQMGAKAR